jgi:hypothetical protein
MRSFPGACYSWAAYLGLRRLKIWKRIRRNLFCRDPLADAEREVDVKTKSLLKAASVILAYVMTSELLIAQGQQPVRPGEEPEHVIGIVPRDIAESSPFASVTISAQDNLKAGKPAKIYFTIENQSDQDLMLTELVLDARDSKGELLPETDLGCVAHFFSPCHKTKNLASGPKLTLPAHKTYKWDSLLNSQYDLSRPGTDTVIGYVQILVDSKVYNFKTNKIKISVE